MKRNLAGEKKEHERALRLLLEQQVEGVRQEDSLWLDSHLSGCDECSQEAGRLAESMRQARAEVFSVTASPALVRSTQMRVRSRARQLGRESERMLPLWMAAVMALGWTVVSTPLLWGGFSWLGNQLHTPALLWQGGFVFSWIAPTALIGAAAISRRERMETAHK